MEQDDAEVGELRPDGEGHRAVAGEDPCRRILGRERNAPVGQRAKVGNALVGDALYGKPHLVSAFHRQALHAFRLGLVHPGSRKECEWQAGVPEDFADLLDRAGIALASTGA